MSSARMHRPALEGSRGPGRRDQLQTGEAGVGVGVGLGARSVFRDGIVPPPHRPPSSDFYLLFLLLKEKKCFDVGWACACLGVCVDACSLLIFCLVIGFSARFWRACFPLSVYMSVCLPLSFSFRLSLYLSFPPSPATSSLTPPISPSPSFPSFITCLQPLLRALPRIPHPSFLAKADRQVV